MTIKFADWENPFLTEEERAFVHTFAKDNFNPKETDTWVQAGTIADLHYSESDDLLSENFGLIEVFAYGLNGNAEEGFNTDTNREEFVGVFHNGGFHVRAECPPCPECGSATYVLGGDEDYVNRWCTDCEWFEELEVAN